MIVRGFTGGPFAENAYLVSCVGSGKAIVIDPGATIGELLSVAEESSLDVIAIVLTHAHIDHIDGAAEAKRRTGAPISLHPADEQLYHAAPLQGQWFGVQVEPPPPLDGHLADGDRIAFGGCELEVRFTPGHAPGHVVLVGEGMALVGDCVFNGSIGRTDLPGGDLETLMKSIRQQILTLPDETVLYPGHGPETTVGHERATNPYLVGSLGGSAFA
ncbi:MAG: MBL fold metallo-hydrolase [Gemmatimonadetes bacterium]|nr:MBL fold metallo-hydrolase [Gemmatimonadota bacterium]